MTLSSHLSKKKKANSIVGVVLLGKKSNHVYKNVNDPMPIRRLVSLDLNDISCENTLERLMGLKRNARKQKFSLRA